MPSLPESPINPLAALLANCDPGKPAPAALYADRTKPLASWLAPALSAVQTGKWLLLGQNGVGKSSELARVSAILQKNFCVLTPPIDRTLELSHCGWHTILVVAALEATRGVQDDDPETGEEWPISLHLETALKRAMPKLTVAATPSQWIRNDPRAAHELIDSNRAQFWDAAISLLRHYEALRGKPLLFILDGLEKLGEGGAQRMFGDERRHLLDIPFAVLTTAPLFISFWQSFGDIEGDFIAAPRLRAPSHKLDELGYKFLWDIAVRRGASGVVSNAIIDQMISWSGGLPRQLVQLLAASATQALSDGQATVTEESFARARLRVSERWQYQLDAEDLGALQKPIPSIHREQKEHLLRVGAIVEYERSDGGLAQGINPLVGALVGKKK